MSFKFKSLQSLVHVNILMFIIDEYFQPSVLLISFLYLVLILFLLFEIVL